MRKEGTRNKKLGLEIGKENERNLSREESLHKSTHRGHPQVASDC